MHVVTLVLDSTLNIMIVIVFGHDVYLAHDNKETITLVEDLEES